MKSYQARIGNNVSVNITENDVCAFGSVHRAMVDQLTRILSHFLQPGEEARLYDLADGMELGEGPITYNNLQLLNLV